MHRLIEEIGLEPERAEFLHFSRDDEFENLERLVSRAVKRLCALGPSALQTVQSGQGH
jgi:coenzyme F420-reducing hydrogenase delta subunit